VHADEKLTAFVELESAIRGCSELLDKLAGFLPNSTVIKRILN
jgi:Tfp pilus assembly protein PilN